MNKENLLRYAIDELNYSSDLTEEMANKLSKLLRDEADYLDELVYLKKLK